MPNTQLTLRLLGLPTLLTGGNPVALSPGATLLCAYLALAPKEGRSRETAAAQLFSDCPSPTARRRLNTALWRLRSEVRAETGLDIVAADTSKRVSLSSAVEVSLDAHLFEQLVAPALAGRPDALTAPQASALEAAVSMHRGELVEQCADEWIMAERARIENLFLTALDYLLQHYGGTWRGWRHRQVRRYGARARAVARGHPPAPHGLIRGCRAETISSRASLSDAALFFLTNLGRIPCPRRSRCTRGCGEATGRPTRASTP